VIKKLTKTEVDYGILLLGAEVELEPDKDYRVFCIDKEYIGHTHKTQKGRVGRLTDFIREKGFKEGDCLIISFNDFTDEIIVTPIVEKAQETEKEESNFSDVAFGIDEAVPDKLSIVSSKGDEWAIVKETIESNGAVGTWSDEEFRMETVIQHYYVLVCNGKMVKQLDNSDINKDGYTFLGEKNGYIYIKNYANKKTYKFQI